MSPTLRSYISSLLKFHRWFQVYFYQHKLHSSFIEGQLLLFGSTPSKEVDGVSSRDIKNTYSILFLLYFAWQWSKNRVRCREDTELVRTPLRVTRNYNIYFESTVTFIIEVVTTLTKLYNQRENTEVKPLYDFIVISKINLFYNWFTNVLD